MTEQLTTGTISSLIKLLDDPDENVFELLHDKLVSMGTDALGPLSEALENCFDEQLESRISSVINSIHRVHLYEEFSSWCRMGTDDLLKGFFLLSKTRFRDLDETEISSLIAQLKTDIWIELHDDLTALENIRIINHFLYQVHHFQGNKDDLTAPGNSFINTLLTSKKGSPLTLGILYIILARQLGLPVFGVNLPQHFILAYLKETDLVNPDEGDVLFYINPFNEGVVFSRHEIDQFIGQLKVKPDRSFYSPCTNGDVIKRLIQNLIFSYNQRGMTDESDELEKLLTAFK